MCSFITHTQSLTNPLLTATLVICCETQNQLEMLGNGLRRQRELALVNQNMITERCADVLSTFNCIKLNCYHVHSQSPILCYHSNVIIAGFCFPTHGKMTSCDETLHLSCCGRWCSVWPRHRTSWDGTFQIIQGPSATSSSPLRIKVPLADVVIVTSAAANTHVPTMLATFRSHNAEAEAMVRASLLRMGFIFTRYAPQSGRGKQPSCFLTGYVDPTDLPHPRIQ